MTRSVQYLIDCQAVNNEDRVSVGGTYQGIPLANYSHADLYHADAYICT
jgi:hypothetical protein